MDMIGGECLASKKMLGSLALVALLVGMVAAAVIIEQYYLPQQFTVTGSSVAIYIDTVLVENETLIDWGTVQKGISYIANLTVVNISNETITVYFTVSNPPVDWTFSWTANATVLLPTEAAEGTLTVTIPATAIDDTYLVDTYIMVG